MKKLIVLLISFSLFGCEIYEQDTYPQLSGRWVIDGVTFPQTNSSQIILLSDTVILSERQLETVDENGVGLFTYDWNNPNIAWHDKFVIGQTVWEFETNKVGIPDRDEAGMPFYTEWNYYFLVKDLYCYKDCWNQIEIKSFRKRNLTIHSYGYNKITLGLPTVWTMYRYNGETYMLEVDVRLILKRI